MLNFEKFTTELREVGLNFAVEKGTRVVKPCAGGEYNQCETCLFHTDEYLGSEFACDIHRLHWLFKSEYDKNNFTAKEKHFLLMVKDGKIRTWKTHQGIPWAEYVTNWEDVFGLEEFDLPFAGLIEGEHDVEALINEIYFIDK